MFIARRGLVMGAAGAVLASRTAGAQAPVELQFWEGHSVQEETATLRMIAAFEVANPGIKIVRTKIAVGANFEKITTAVASGSPPDVCPIWGGFLPQFADAGHLLDLTPYGAASVKSAVYRTGWDYVNWKGGIWGVPYAVDPRFLAFNAAAWREAGLTGAPATLNNLYDYAKALTKKSGSGTDRYGIGFSASTDLLTSYVNLIYAHGGRIFTEDESEVAFNNAEGVATGELLRRLVADGYAAFGVAIDGLRRALLTGRVATMIDGAWILYAQSQFPEKVEIDVAPLPRPQAGQRSINVSSVGGYVVFKQCKHPAEAAKFVQFMATPQAQQYRVQLLKTGVSPAVVNESYARETFAKWPTLAKVQSYMADGTLYPVTPRWSRVVDALQPAIEAIGSGANPKSTLDDAARQANRSLRRA